MIKIKDVENITSLKNPNALELVNKFVTNGILHEITGKKRNRIYSFRDYIEIFNS